MKNLKFLTLVGLMLFFISCGEKKSEPVVIDREYTGELTVEDLIKSPYTNAWFTPRKNQYVPPAEALSTIQEHINDFEIEVYMGTWCSDSQAEIPRFYKILDETKFDQKNKLKVFTLDENYQSKNRDEKGKNITNVPTIIFYKDGKETNRFVESPQESLARDMAKIVSGKPYKHIYE